MFSFKPYPVLLGLAMLLVFARPAMAFGAGNIASISKVEGENCKALLVTQNPLSVCMLFTLSLSI